MWTYLLVQVSHWDGEPLTRLSNERRSVMFETAVVVFIINYVMLHYILREVRKNQTDIARVHSKLTAISNFMTRGRYYE